MPRTLLDQSPQQLTLPPVVKTIARTQIGPVWQILRQQSVEQVSDLEEVRVSPRKVERLFTLESGMRVIWTERRSCPPQVTADGSLSPALSFSKAAMTEYPDGIRRMAEDTYSICSGRICPPVEATLVARRP